MSKRVFISYSRDDRQFAEQIISELKNSENFAVLDWMNYSYVSSEHEISNNIRHSLKNSSAVLVLLSPASINNRWINFEIGAAQSFNIKIIPVIVKGENIEHFIPDYLRDFKIIDGRNKSARVIAQEIQRNIY